VGGDRTVDPMTGPIAAPLGYPPDTIMTREQVAAALGVSPDTVERNGAIPVSYALGPRTPRYLWGDVVAWMRQSSAA
jgi:hypothetical protein